MPRRCRTCAHEAREVVELQAVRGAPVSAVSGRHGRSPSGLRRRLAEHLPAALVDAEAAREATSAEALLGETLGLEAKALEFVALAQEDGDVRAAVVALREALALRVKVAGTLGKANGAGAFTVVWEDAQEARERLERHSGAMQPMTFAEFADQAAAAAPEKPAE